MGGINSKEESEQVLIVGQQKSGKTLLFKRFIDNKKETHKTNIESTLGYNHTTSKICNVTYDLWDLGGDNLTKSYWPTFYRNLRFSLVIFVINIADESTFTTELKDLLILLNEEELKQARFFILFNMVVDNQLKIKMGESLKNLYMDTAEELISHLKECNVHEFEFRVSWDILDILKLTDADCEFLNKNFISNVKAK